MGDLVETAPGWPATRRRSRRAAEQRVGADERFGMRLQRSQLNPVLDRRGALATGTGNGTGASERRWFATLLGEARVEARYGCTASTTRWPCDPPGGTNRRLRTAG